MLIKLVFNVSNSSNKVLKLNVMIVLKLISNCNK